MNGNDYLCFKSTLKFPNFYKGYNVSNYDNLLKSQYNKVLEEFQELLNEQLKSHLFESELLDLITASINLYELIAVKKGYSSYYKHISKLNYRLIKDEINLKNIQADKNLRIVQTVLNDFKSYKGDKPQLINEGHVFIINGDRKDIDMFINMCGMFTKVNQIGSLDIPKDMSNLIDLQSNVDFLNDLKKLIYKYTNQIDIDIQNKIKPDCFNFIVIDEKFFNKMNYKNYTKILISNDNENINCYDKYNHIILKKSNDLMFLTALEFCKLYSI